jgi:subtilisin
MSQSRHRRALGTLLLVLTIATLAASNRVSTAAGSFEAAQSPENRVDVLIGFGLTPGPPEEALVRSVGGQVRFRYHLVPAIAATIPSRAVQALLANPRVTAVEADLRVSALDLELDDSWGVKRIGAGSAHDGGIWGVGVRVAVIDTGIDYTHPDLALNHAGGHDFVNGDADPFDDHGHGTHVAGIVAARDDGAGVVGAAPQAIVYALKVLDATGTGAFSSVIAALQWAVDNGVQVTNNSYGSSQDPGDIVRQAFDNAEAAGLLHVAAAGNSGTCLGSGDNVEFPARYASVVAVAATDSLDASPCFSSTGPDVELSAPGVEVNSTIPGGGYQLFSGTSMAAPHVAGTAALILSQGVVSDTNGNGRVTDEVRQRLISTAQDLGAEGHDTWYGYGLVDARAATGATAPRDPDVMAGLTANKSLYVLGIDASAQLTMVVKDENGADIAGLDPSHFTTRVDGAIAPVQFAPTPDGRYSGALALSSLATGSHAVDVVVTDARGESDSASTSFTVSLGIKAQSIAYSLSGTAGKRSLAIVVSVVDPAGNVPVQGAKVTIHVAKNGVAYYGLTATTDRGGKAKFTIKNAPSACYATTIAGIAIVNRIWDQSTPPNGYCF